MKIDLIKQGYSAKVYKKEEKEGIFVYKIQKNYNLHRLECCNLKWLENYNLYCPKLISEGM